MSAPLGCPRGIVQILPYQAAWATAFDAEAAALRDALGPRLVNVAHIGSTAVPGLAAKPILDLMVALDNLALYDQALPDLARVGYVFRTDSRADQDHVLCVKGPQACRTHYLKLTTKGSAFWQAQIRFRDALRRSATLRAEYTALKQRLLNAHNGARPPYTAGKSEFVARVLALSPGALPP